MDFNDIKKTLSDTFNSASEKAKNAAGKALEFVEDKLQETPLFVRTQDEYNSLVKERRAIILAFDEKNEISKELMVLLPVWQTEAFIDSATFRYMNFESSAEIIKNENYSPLEMRVYFEGQENFRFHSAEEIKNWWKAREYQRSVSTNISTLDTNLDPLSHL